MPMILFESGMRKEVGYFLIGHGVLWLLGLTGLYVGYIGLLRRAKERDTAETELTRLNNILEEQATTDALTGIYNRRKFLEKLQEKILEAKRYKISMELLFIDIDHFKLVNDTYGHETGDNVLLEFTGIITGMTRQSDVFARLGGEEFVVLVQRNDNNTGRFLAEKIRSSVEQHSFQQVGTITCSIGVAQHNETDTTESIIKRADDAMYAAKQAGRNRVETSSASMEA